MSNESKNEYIIFCKEHNSKSKNNTTRLPLYIMNGTMRSLAKLHAKELYI